MDLLKEGRDPFSDDVGHQNILVVGPAGSGKTFIAPTMPGKIAILSAEAQGVDNIKQAIVHHGKNREDVKIFKVENKYDPADPRRRRLLKNDKGKPMTAVQYVYDFIETLSFDNMGFTSVVLDSLTALQELEKFWAKEDKQRLTQSDWGEIIEDVIKVCVKFRDLKLHTMVIATTTAAQDDENRMHHRVSLFGKKLPNDLPRYFNIAVTLQRTRDRESGQNVHSVITAGDHRYVTKGHLALDEREVPNAGVWFKKMSEFWEANGGVALPTEGEVTSTTPEVDPEEDKLQARLESPKIKELFDALKAPEPKLINGAWDRNNPRVAALMKYRSDIKLVEQLQKRLDEKQAKEDDSK